MLLHAALVIGRTFEAKEATAGRGGKGEVGSLVATRLLIYSSWRRGLTRSPMCHLAPILLQELTRNTLMLRRMLHLRRVHSHPILASHISTPCVAVVVFRGWLQSCAHTAPADTAQCAHAMDFLPRSISYSSCSSCSCFLLTN